MAGEIRASVVRNDADGGSREIPEERGVRLCEMKDDGCGVRSFDGSDHAERAALGRVGGGVENGIERRFDVCGGEWTAIVEMDTCAKMESIGESIGRAPGIGEVAVEIHLIIAFEKAAEEQAVDLLGLRVGGEAGVEICRVGFDQESQRGRIAGVPAAATGRRKEKGCNAEGTEQTQSSPRGLCAIEAGHTRFYREWLGRARPWHWGDCRAGDEMFRRPVERTRKPPLRRSECQSERTSTPQSR